MVDNQHENLPWKISLNITLRPNHIFRCIEEGLGCFMPWGFHEGLWSLVEKFWHTNVLELKAVRLAFLSFTDRQHGSSLLFTSHGRHPEQTLIKILKIIWGYLVERNIHLTAEYILSLNNQTADWNSRNFQDSSKWNLCPTFFTQICSHLWKPLLDLSASRLCHQLPRYIAW